MSEGNASTSETNAASSAGTATTQAGTATTQAGIATTQAGNAATSASNASTSASNASTAETNAQTAETNAETAETGAVAAQVAAEAAWDSFDDVYLGAKSSNPTLDNDGNALATGALYFNTTSDDMFVWSGSAWEIAYAAAGSVEGTSVASTGEVGGTKFLREDGDDSCSWQAVPIDMEYATIYEADGSRRKLII